MVCRPGSVATLVGTAQRNAPPCSSRTGRPAPPPSLRPFQLVCVPLCCTALRSHKRLCPCAGEGAWDGDKPPAAGEFEGHADGAALRCALLKFSGWCASFTIEVRLQHPHCCQHPLPDCASWCMSGSLPPHSQPLWALYVLLRANWREEGSTTSSQGPDHPHSSSDVRGGYMLVTLPHRAGQPPRPIRERSNARLSSTCHWGAGVTRRRPGHVVTVKEALH